MRGHPAQKALSPETNAIHAGRNHGLSTISREVAVLLCPEISGENQGKWLAQCWGCVKLSKGDATKMCFSGRPDNRGCGLVNALYNKVGGR